MEKVVHLGAEFSESRYGFKLKKETYLPTLTDRVRKLFSVSELKRYINECYKNFDLNINFCKHLSKEKFDKCVNNFFDKYKEFHQIFDITETKDKIGYYIMILDEYKQVYVGTSNSCIYKRIRKHMSSNQEFDRLLWGSWKSSIISINSFRPLDTTRIYVYYTKDSFSNENKYIKGFKKEYVLNRTIGGKLRNGLFDAAVHSRERNLQKFLW